MVLAAAAIRIMGGTRVTRPLVVVVSWTTPSHERNEAASSRSRLRAKVVITSSTLSTVHF
eukprot:jgi/Chlat1/3169/Chrsp22S03451